MIEKHRKNEKRRMIDKRQKNDKRLHLPFVENLVFQLKDVRSRVSENGATGGKTTKRVSFLSKSCIFVIR